MIFVKIAGIALAALCAAAQAQDPNVGLGQRLFRAHCASCHGEDARGDGWMAQYLTRRPANLTLLAKRSGGVFPADDVRATIDGRNDVKLHGPRDMPVWGERYEGTLGQGSDAAAAARRRIDALADYLATLQK